MNYNRRSVLALCGGAMLAVANTSWAVPEGVGEQASLGWPSGEALPTLDELLAAPPVGLGIRGTLPPTQQEAIIARRILANAPKATTPFNVAMYFHSIGLGNRDREWRESMGIPEHNWRKYVMEWPKRYNPVILSFFDATDYRKPEGDCTAWCAAFANWCIRRGNTERTGVPLVAGTNSAASATFRNWNAAARTASPEQGDIVVFKSLQSAAHGHVGFFFDQDRSHVWVLGGNQAGRQGRWDPEAVTTCSSGGWGGMVSVSKYPKRSNALELYAFRTHPSFRSA